MRVLSVFALAVGLAACAHSQDLPYARAIAKGERAQSSGRTHEARLAYEEARKIAASDLDRKHAEELAVDMQIREGDVAGALVRLEPIARANPPTDHSAHALYTVARLRIDHGDEDGGWATMKDVLARFPNTAFGRRALRLLLDREDERAGAEAGLNYLRAQQPIHREDDLSEPIAYLIAEHFERLGRLNEAREQYLFVVKTWPFPYGDLFDDSLVRSSKLAEDAGDLQAAASDLERLLATREVSHLMGTYQRPRYTQALWHLAELHRDKLNDAAGAKRLFHTLVDEYQTSTKRDDALWEIAKIEQRAGENSCATLRKLMSDFPDSRYVPCAAKQCADKRPEKSRAPAECHYSLAPAGRTIEGVP